MLKIHCRSYTPEEIAKKTDKIWLTFWALSSDHEACHLFCSCHVHSPANNIYVNFTFNRILKNTVGPTTWDWIYAYEHLLGAWNRWLHNAKQFKCASRRIVCYTADTATRNGILSHT
ncbi:unnamed protein product [Lactuca virosa]|uniref:Uncharacterized protein n=1 Tax=Lactuca virosa TaxID=75947 RepID=A0AAU9LRW3_9ASTR|nr:unnamed protein product [Lactuca virosa]